MIRNWLRNWLGVFDPEPVLPDEKPEEGISYTALAYLMGDDGKPASPFTPPTLMPGVHPAMPAGGQMAMDMMPANIAAANSTLWAQQGIFHEGVTFLGYQYLAELTQRAEYRMIVETIARDCTRKWIKLTGADDEKLTKLREALEKYQIQARYRHALELDGYYGRGQIFIDLGDVEGASVGKPLAITSATVGKGRLRGFTVVEPIWSYPSAYESTNPLSPTFYRPLSWYVMGRTVHSDRLLTIVGRELPDVLKPMYAFGGLSMTQMAKPYVDNWLRTRQSVSDLIHSFSVPVLKTNMGQVLSGVGAALGRAAQSLMNRLRVFTHHRDNRGVMAIDKDTEDFMNVTTPLSSLDKLQAQSQEHMASVAGVPLVVLLGITPSGLNASSDGEITAYYDKLLAYNEKFRPQLKTMIDVVQLSEFGEIDTSIGFEFNSLWEMDEAERAAIRKTNADTDAVYIGQGVVSNDEVRERLSEEKDGMYKGVDLSGDAPTPPAERMAEADREAAEREPDAKGDNEATKP